MAGFGFGSRKFDDRLTEEHDPSEFSSEKVRQRGIRFDRWAGRHRVIFTLVVMALMATAGYFAWRRVFDGQGVFWLVLVEVGFVVGGGLPGWRLAGKARRKYQGE
ncbi:hypothetical protein [Amycolatopsis regifaucium]|uniref:Uncharacterized protein n=1 Tax=Amycolatopsis regifaucium TaxID=546365 RepID=A0A154M4W3_9PSEU|nr:hypothetical protein [Amycolatopsis regifaucium]KZB79671.1 hypothetical protein AVL48_14795 [Amycolatopsis regifaucium]OKA10013.1 hypothetical protein ATP06_0206620 [Amycolatopsis regifaucium]SFI65153.1 hypothetical protein SAMN04489731_11263 [Amycolatopsis regifaucium]